MGTGTSQGVPVIGCHCEVCASADVRDQRLRTSILIENEKGTIVVDTGPDFRQQMLAYRVQRLDAILFTHEHRDHTAGLDDVRAFNFKQRAAADIYATDHVQGELRKQFDYIFANYDYPGVPKVQFHTIGEEPFDLLGIRIQPIRVWHYRLPVLGFRFNDFTYITDANRIEPEELKKIKGSKGLVLNALRKEEHISHFTLDEAVRLVGTTGVPQAWFTHISHQMGLHQDVQQTLPAHIHLAYDGLTISMP